MQQKPKTLEDYQQRVNLVIEHIHNHLGEVINLNVLAETAGFSPYHFHRIMKAFTGEPLGTFITRARMETAARLLRYSELPVQEIAWQIGYEMPSTLSKTFRQFYDISPNEYRKNKNHIIMKTKPFTTELKLKAPKIIDQPAKQVIYIRHSGSYSELDYPAAWQRLWAFVKEHKLFTAGIEHFCIYHNDPQVTETEKLRTDICLVVHKPVAPQGEVGVKELEGGKFALFTYVGPYSNLGLVYDTIYRQWLPESGEQLRMMVPCYEKYCNNPEKTVPEKLRTEIYIPLQ